MRPASRSQRLSKMYSSLQLPWSPSSFATSAEILYRDAGLVRTRGTIFLLPPTHPQLHTAFNAPPRPKTRMSSGAVALCKHFERNSRPAPQPSSEEPNANLSGRSSDRAAESISDSDDVSVNANDKDEIETTTSTRRDQAAAKSYKLVKRKGEDPPHPYWDAPRGSNEEKTRIADQVLDRVLESAVWRNVMLLHEGVAVYEVRTRQGWGMRWTLGIKRVEGSKTDVEIRGEEAEKAQHDSNRDELSEQQEWKITEVTFRGLLEPIAGLDHELDLTEDQGV